MRSRKMPASGPWTSILPRVLASMTATAGARRRALAQDRVVHRLVGVDREVARPLPLADVLEDGTGGDVPVLDRGDPDRVGQERAAVAAGDLGEARPARAAAGRSARRRPRRPGRAGRGDRAGHDAAGAALLDARADRRVALDVLDRLQAGAERALEVGQRRVATRVEVVVPGRVAVLGRHDPGRRRSRRGPRCRRRRPRPRSSATVGGGRVRDEGRDALVVAQRAAGVGPQRDVRVPAAGHEQEVGLDPPGRRCRTAASPPSASASVPGDRASPRRASTTATTSTPASASAASTSRVVSLVVNTTARVPGRTP